MRQNLRAGSIARGGRSARTLIWMWISRDKCKNISQCREIIHKPSARVTTDQDYWGRSHRPTKNGWEREEKKMRYYVVTEVTLFSIIPSCFLLTSLCHLFHLFSFLSYLSAFIDTKNPLLILPWSDPSPLDLSVFLLLCLYFFHPWTSMFYTFPPSHLYIVS